MQTGLPAAARKQASAEDPTHAIVAGRAEGRSIAYLRLSLPIVMVLGLILVAHSLTLYEPGNLVGFLWPMAMRLLILGLPDLRVVRSRRAEKEFSRAEAHYREIVEQSLEGIYQTSPEGRWLSANPALARMLSYDSPADMVGARVDLNREFYVDPGRRPEFRRQMAEKDSVQNFESEVVAKDGRRMWISESARAVRDDRGALRYFEGRTMDITARKEAQAALHTEYERQAGWIRELETRTREIGLLSDLSSMLQSCSRLEEAYAIVAEHTRWLFPDQSGALYVVGEARSYTDRVAAWGSAIPPEGSIEPEDCWGLRRGRIHRAMVPFQVQPEAESAMFCKHVHAPLPAAILCAPLVAQGETLGLLHLRLPDGVNRLAWGGSPKNEPYPEGQIQLAQAVAGSLAVAIANIRLQQKLREQSIRDPLTGLFNRRHLQETLERAVWRAQSEHEPLAVLMVDIDHFKAFNDTHGHEAGDAMLHELGRFLTSEIREEDIACRYGGEEFALILPGATLQAGRERAEHLRKGARELTLSHHRQTLGPLSLSVGLAHMPSHASTAPELMRAADAAMYRAKAKGRDQVRLAEVREGADASSNWT